MEEAAVIADLSADHLFDNRHRVDSDTATRYGVEVVCAPNAVAINGVASATWAYDVLEGGGPIGRVHQLVTHIPGAWRMTSAHGRTPKAVTSLDGAIETIVYQARRP
jgi:hypothetical protein